MLANGSAFVNRDTYNPSAVPSGSTTGFGVFSLEIEMKKCTKCGEEKPATMEFFYKGKKRKDGSFCLRAVCKLCMNKYGSNWRLKPDNKDRLSKYAKKYRNKPDVKARLAEKHKIWRDANPNYVSPCVKTNPNYNADYRRERRKNDPNFRFIDNMRRRFNIWLRSEGEKKQYSVFELTGCTLSELWDHLESQFENGMTRENYGEWHVDHIIPLSAFNPNCWMQMSIAWDVDNLQPLWAEDNLRKSAKII